MRTSVLWSAMVLWGLALVVAACGNPTAAPDAPTATGDVVATTAPSALPTETATTGMDPTATMAPSEVPAETATPRVEPTATTAPTSMPTEAPTETPTPMAGGEGPGNADVLHVRAVQDADGSWTFHVTVEHPDTGWEDYADGWDVVTPDGTVLKPDPESQFTRTLLHPHVNEQPFTRSQSGIEIPEGVTEARVRAHDLVDGFGGQEVVVDLTVASGPNFEVER
jgi:hypothetical protein